MKFRDLIGSVNPKELWDEGHWCGVVSSNIAAVFWVDNTLLVRFHSGVVYRYLGVTQDLAFATVSGGSVGRAFNALIKPFYLCERVETYEFN
jgi:hypothetical protein